MLGITKTDLKELSAAQMLANWLILVLLVAVSQASPALLSLSGIGGSSPTYERIGLPLLLRSLDLKASRAPGCLLVDARSLDDYRLGHIPGAIHFEKVAPPLPQTGRIIVYCEDVLCSRAAFVAAAFVRAGSPDVCVYTGGWNEWKTSNLPVEN